MIGDELDCPDMQELLRQPIIDFAPIEWARKNGSEYVKYLLDKAPLANNTKYIYMCSVIRVVYPGVFINKIELPNLGHVRNEWHCDSLIDPDSRVHVISSAIGTEFNTQPFSFDVPRNVGYHWFCEQAIRNEKRWRLTPKNAPTKRFVTFNNHVHRAQIPDKPEVRFLLRIMEANTAPKMVFETENYQRNFSLVFEGTKEVKNVIQHEDGKVELRVPKEYLQLL
jgi:hypothetical protein